MAVSSRRNRRVTQEDPPLVQTPAHLDKLDDRAESAAPAEPVEVKPPRVAKKRLQTRANNENDARLLADRPPHWG